MISKSIFGVPPLGTSKKSTFPVACLQHMLHCQVICCSKNHFELLKQYNLNLEKSYMNLGLLPVMLLMHTLLNRIDVNMKSDNGGYRFFGDSFNVEKADASAKLIQYEPLGLLTIGIHYILP